MPISRRNISAPIPKPFPTAWLRVQKNESQIPAKGQPLEPGIARTSIANRNPNGDNYFWIKALFMAIYR